jgi:hypothetical protein
MVKTKTEKKVHEGIKADFAKAKPRKVTIKGKIINAQTRVTKMKPPVTKQPASRPAIPPVPHQ